MSRCLISKAAWLRPNEEITWVLTSYITAAAIMTAPVGWLAARFGRKYLFIGCLIGFTLASMLCGAAQSLPQITTVRSFPNEPFRSV